MSMGFQFREGGELSAKDGGASIISRETDGRIHEHRVRRTAHASQLRWSRQARQSESL